MTHGRDTRGKVMGDPWNTLGVPGESHRKPMGALQTHGSPLPFARLMEEPWEHYNTVEFPWSSMGDPCEHSKLVGVPWASTVSPW